MGIVGIRCVISSDGNRIWIFSGSMGRGGKLVWEFGQRRMMRGRIRLVGRNVGRGLSWMLCLGPGIGGVRLMCGRVKIIRSGLWCPPKPRVFFFFPVIHL